MAKIKAIYVDCAGVVNDGESGHMMRDYCSSCAPFWARIPTCPINNKKLTIKGFCSTCRKYYDISK